jgi:uncharacterized membrane protein
MKPLKGKVLIEVIPPPTMVENSFGIITEIMTNVTIIPTTGFVKEVGEGIEDIQVGDRVLFEPSCNNEVMENLHLMKYDCIKAVLEKDAKLSFKTRKQAI